MTYTVKSGDTLSKIGSKFNVSWREIARVNGISSPYTIYPGQKLKIPSDSGGGVSSPGGNNDSGSGVYPSGSLTDKIIGGVLLYGLFKVLMKVF